MTTKKFRMEDGSEKLFTKVRGEWIPAIKHEKQKIAEQEDPSMAALQAYGANFDELMEGIDKLAGTDMYQDIGQEELPALREAHPMATGVGDMAAEIGQIATTGGALGGIARGTGLAKAAANSPVLRATLADVAGSAAVGGARDPGAEGSRTDNAGSEALWSLLGGALSKGMAGVTPSKAGKEALERGEYLTPGYATDNHVLSGLESAMEVTPTLAHGTKVARGKAQQGWRNHAFDTVAKKLGIKATGETGIESFKQIDNAIKSGYKEAFANIDSVPDSVFDSMFKTVSNRSADLSIPDQVALKNIAKKLRQFRTKARKGKSTDLADRIDYYLRNEAKGTQGPLRDAIIGLKKTYHRGFGSDLESKLKNFDEVFPDVLTLEDAVNKANLGMMEGGFSPQQLMSGSANVGTKNAFARGESALFDIANSGGKTVGQKEGGAPLEWFRRLAGVAPSPPGMELLGNTVIGNTAAHKAVKDLPSMLLETANPSKILPASRDEDEDNLMRLLKEIMGS